ncbi:MAG TPA: hypothetical protein VGD80_07565 [Kofleriaceae bacterium]
MNFEDELIWRDRVIRIAPLRGDSPRVNRHGPATLPAALVSFAERAERISCVDDDLAVACSDAMATKLTNRMWQRARELATQGRLASPLPADVSRLGRECSPQEIIEVLGAVVCAHLEYDDAEAVARSFDGSVLGLVLEIAKVTWRGRGRKPVRIAWRVTGRGVARGVCRQYAVAVRTLFHALKRATGAPSDAFVVEVTGEAFGLQDQLHVWNWLIDTRGASIEAFDATPTREPRRNLAIDLNRYSNMSAFLATAVVGAAKWNGYDPDNVAEILAACIDPESDRGQVLLFGIADHLGVKLGVRNRIAAHLAARNFERLLPDWRARLARRTAHWGPLGRKLFAETEHDMLPLAQLRLATADPGSDPLV